MSGFLGKHCMSGFLRKRFVLLPFANKNVFEENLTYNKVVCLEVFITKQGFGEPLKTSKACFLRNIIFYLKK
jgi:hypothetical protein